MTVTGEEGEHIAQMQLRDVREDGRIDGVATIQSAGMKRPQEVRYHDFKGRHVKVALVSP